LRILCESRSAVITTTGRDEAVGPSGTRGRTVHCIGYDAGRKPGLKKVSAYSPRTLHIFGLTQENLPHIVHLAKGLVASMQKSASDVSLRDIPEPPAAVVGRGPSYSP